MVTAFGIGGLAVALALQDPLPNFFAGLLKFTVFLQACELRDQFVVTHEFIKRLLARFAREGIVIRV